MQLTSIVLSLLALPIAIANPCTSGEVGVGLFDFSNIGTGPEGDGNPGPDNTDAVIFDSNCNSLDNAAGTYNFCDNSRWYNGYEVACSGSQVISISNSEHVWFPCYVPSGNGLCGNFLNGHASVFYCCQPVRLDGDRIFNGESE